MKELDWKEKLISSGPLRYCEGSAPVHLTGEISGNEKNLTAILGAPEQLAPPAPVLWQAIKRQMNTRPASPQHVAWVSATEKVIRSLSQPLDLWCLKNNSNHVLERGQEPHLPRVCLSKLGAVGSAEGNDTPLLWIFSWTLTVSSESAPALLNCVICGNTTTRA